MNGLKTIVLAVALAFVAGCAGHNPFHSIHRDERKGCRERRVQGGQEVLPLQHARNR